MKRVKNEFKFNKKGQNEFKISEKKVKNMSEKSEKG